MSAPFTDDLGGGTKVTFQVPDGRMVQRYVVSLETIDMKTGEREIDHYCEDGMAAFEVVGMLEEHLYVARAEFDGAWVLLPDDDEEEDEDE